MLLLVARSIANAKYQSLLRLSSYLPCLTEAFPEVVLAITDAKAQHSTAEVPVFRERYGPGGHLADDRFIARGRSEASISKGIQKRTDQSLEGLERDRDKGSWRVDASS